MGTINTPAKSPLVLTAATAWAILTFPCAHLGRFYISLARDGQNPALFHSYIQRAALATLVLSVVGSGLLWLLPDKWMAPARLVAPACGAILGLLLPQILWRILQSPFQAIAGHSLSPDHFQYLGLVAGIIAGDLRRRAASSALAIAPSESSLKYDFY
jgi:hypothetical protein